jgi:hypothetical protein
MSSLVGRARQHARMPLEGREEKRKEEIWWQTREKPRRAHPGLRRRLSIMPGLVSKGKGGWEGRHGTLDLRQYQATEGDESVRAGSGSCQNLAPDH